MRRRIWRTATVGIIAAFALASPPPGQSAPAKPAPRLRTAITCAWPVGPNDSARTLLRRFGRQARMADIGIGEGETRRGVELFFNDARRRLAVLFQDSARRRPEKVQSWDERAPWTVAGIRMGDSLESVARRNGRAFTLQQFGADYGGTLGSFEGGALATAMGNCEPWMIFSPGGDYPGSLSGDGETSSDHPDMGRAKAHVEALGVRFSPPPDQ